MSDEERRHATSAKAWAALQKMHRNLYEQEGQPYGDTPEGFRRWMGEAEERQKKNAEEFIRANPNLKITRLPGS